MNGVESIEDEVLLFAQGMGTLCRATGFMMGAGHGSQVPDPTGDETDGLNETLCPCDFKHVRLRLPSPLIIQIVKAIGTPMPVTVSNRFQHLRTLITGIYAQDTAPLSAAQACILSEC